MAKNEMLAKLGSWAFIGGIILAGLVGIYQATTIEEQSLVKLNMVSLVQK
jgi:hypothetical protein